MEERLRKYTHLIWQLDFESKALLMAALLNYFDGVLHEDNKPIADNTAVSILFDLITDYKGE